MDLITLINQIIVLFGVPTIVMAALHIGRKFEVLDRLGKTIDRLEPEVRDMNIRLSIIERQLSKMF